MSPTHVHGSLKSSRPSRLEIIGYHGSNTQFGKSSSILSGCAIGSEIPFTFDTDTTKDLNDLLFSFTDMYERQNFCLSLTQPGVYSVAKLIFNRRKCNTKLAQELDQASSISPNDVQIVSALASALAMPATTPDSTGRFKSMTQKQLHEILGHFGHLPGCIICLQVKKNLNRICKNTRPKADPRPGYTCDLDVIYWSFSGVSLRGYRYSIILRDRFTGTPLIVHNIYASSTSSMHATTSGCTKRNHFQAGGDSHPLITTVISRQVLGQIQTSASRSIDISQLDGWRHGWRIASKCSHIFT